MSTTQLPQDAIDAQNLSKDQEKIYNLTLDLLKLEKDKKDMVSGFNEEIKRVKAEIKSIANHEEEPEEFAGE